MPRLFGSLQAIVERKRHDLDRQLEGISLDTLRSYAKPTNRSLRAALAQRRGRFIMEVKRASPSEGALSPLADAAAQALSYKGAADAVSVLTDHRFFRGSLDDLCKVRAVFDGPILAKDFIIDVRQVAEARMHGADAVLVILSILTPEEALAVIEEAKRFNMDVLVEVHDEVELGQAIALNTPLIGINNRNLASLKIDLTVTERLARHVPRDRILVSESGISSRADVERLSPKVDACLVGSALMRSSKPAQTARELAFGRVKVCGLTSVHDALLASDSGASHAGLVFVPGTARAVTLATAEPIVDAARRRGLRAAGVFRNAPVAHVADISQFLALDVVQLHGDEDGDYIAALRSLIGDAREIWAASAVGGGRSSSKPKKRLGADRILFDSEVNGRSGGTGMTFDWGKLHPTEVKTGVLAGGLNPRNARAAARIGAWALDVGSGVEAAPRSKDPDKLKCFFDALRPETRRKHAREVSLELAPRRKPVADG